MAWDTIQSDLYARRGEATVAKAMPSHTLCCTAPNSTERLLSLAPADWNDMRLVHSSDSAE
jgi:hypothetical protein